jgi:DNA anti-recombination protein RmuC
VVVKQKLSQAQDSIDKAETRTRAIQRTLRDVESADALELPGDPESEDAEADTISMLAGATQEK